MVKRINWLDISKGIGILLVIVGHMNINSTFRYLIFSFHMPLFFFISGILFNQEKYFNIKFLVIKRSKSLLIPYLLYSLLVVVTFFLVLDSSFYAGLISILKGTGGPSPMWFVACLFLTEIFAFCLLKINKFHNVILLLIFLFISGYILSVLKIEIIFNINVCFISLLFYLVGYHYKHSFQSLYNREGKLSIILFLLIINIGSVLIYKSLETHHVDMLDNHIGNPFLFITGSFSGIFLIIEISKLIKNSKLLTFFGRNTLHILGLHTVIPAILNQTIYIYMAENMDPFIAKNTVRLLGLTLLIGSVFIINYTKRKYESYLLSQKSI